MPRVGWPSIAGNNSPTSLADGLRRKRPPPTHPSLSGLVEAPFLVVVEAKRGLQAVNPQWQLYGELLAAMKVNTGVATSGVAVMHGCYTVSDTGTFVRGEGRALDSERPSLTIESSREYSGRVEAEQIVGLLQGIAQAARDTG